jgi:hypothetical protein
MEVKVCFMDPNKFIRIHIFFTYNLNILCKKNDFLYHLLQNLYTSTSIIKMTQAKNQKRHARRTRVRLARREQSNAQKEQREQSNAQKEQQDEFEGYEGYEGYENAEDAEDAEYYQHCGRIYNNICLNIRRSDECDEFLY